MDIFIENSETPTIHLLAIVAHWLVRIAPYQLRTTHPITQSHATRKWDAIGGRQ
jgi:hypothetical protein